MSNARFNPVGNWLTLPAGPGDTPAQKPAALQEPRVMTRAERMLAVENFLLAAAQDPATARDHWAVGHNVLVRCGGLFTAVRISGHIVRAAAGSDDRAAVDAYLADALHGGSVFTEAGLARYYVLVPASTAHHWRLPGGECLQRNYYLGVPAPRYTEYEEGFPYWPVPMDSPSELCDPVLVSNLVLRGSPPASARTVQ